MGDAQRRRLLREQGLLPPASWCEVCGKSSPAPGQACSKACAEEYHRRAQPTSSVRLRRSLAPTVALLALAMMQDEVKIDG